MIYNIWSIYTPFISLLRGAAEVLLPVILQETIPGSPSASEI